MKQENCSILEGSSCRKVVQKEKVLNFINRLNAKHNRRYLYITKSIPKISFNIINRRQRVHKYFLNPFKKAYGNKWEKRAYN